MKKNIPFALILLCLLLGILLLVLHRLDVNNFKWYAISFLVIGLLSDVFDGIIARRLKVSTTSLRRWDSSVGLPRTPSVQRYGHSFYLHSDLLFQLTFWIGLATRLEIVAIILILKNWNNDVPSFYHAVQLRKGKIIRRHKLFNG